MIDHQLIDGQLLVIVCLLEKIVSWKSKKQVVFLRSSIEYIED